MSSPTSANITWTPGTGGNSQAIYVGPTESIVHANCNVVGEDCVIQDGLQATDTSYSTGNVLQAGTVYFYKIVNINSTIANCSSGTDTSTSLSSCSLSPSSISLLPSDSTTLTAVINSSPEISRVDFASSNSSVVSISPVSDSTYQYQTVATGVAAGSSVISETRCVIYNGCFPGTPALRG